MFSSEARREVHRRNARRAASLNTAAGEGRSRAQALEYALCFSTIVPEDAELIHGRSTDFFKSLLPQNHYQAWLVTEVTVQTVRIERCQRIERRERDKRVIRAELFWDDDRRLDAAILGESLAGRPEVVLGQLQRTPQGCDWLMTRWSMLAFSAKAQNNSWTPEQTQMAFDLLGTPHAFRVGQTPGVAINFDGEVEEPLTDLATIARREVASLKLRREAVSGLDAINRSLAEADLSDEADPESVAELRRLRRHEATLRSNLRWCMSQMRYQSPHENAVGGLMGRWLGQLQPTIQPPTEQAAPPPPPQSPIPAASEDRPRPTLSPLVALDGIETVDFTIIPTSDAGKSRPHLEDHRKSDRKRA